MDMDSTADWDSAGNGRTGGKEGDGGGESRESSLWGEDDPGKTKDTDMEDCKNNTH